MHALRRLAFVGTFVLLAALAGCRSGSSSAAPAPKMTGLIQVQRFSVGTPVPTAQWYEFRTTGSTNWRVISTALLSAPLVVNPGDTLVYTSLDNPNSMVVDGPTLLAYATSPPQACVPPGPTWELQEFDWEDVLSSTTHP